MTGQTSQQTHLRHVFSRQIDSQGSNGAHKKGGGGGRTLPTVRLPWASISEVVKQQMCIERQQRGQGLWGTF